ncbi:MAG TPA: exodeoxyribonuclease III [Lachnospiraceae bacterium]|jgi:exodeoxyribonuclease-3|nr:exodeoxyribonuclease III [Lachnospiraceae bacterium]HBY72370.1 exodeoxyribonuclease III [Lachnospiraceae bacterium]HCA70407.1 exodeoxyribonuclease III [Lachnospiraceae bacterium]HCM13161.1 exodeoxyribonuclease III [Lachnospiraceae bacterium]HCR41163.1 exodeoxyribonuclease III [Lachnospiraceae bacterium]
MKFVSWNVNGLRACINKGFADFFKQVDADIFCIQETKLQPEQVEISFEGYHQYFNSAVRKGYSGTAVFTKEEPLCISFDLGLEKHNDEGRVITLEYGEFYFVTVYTPNSQRELTRLAYRMEWEEDFRAYLMELDKKKPVIVCGDMNVAHKEIDLKNPKTNTKNAGFTIEEREKMTKLLDSGFVDSFRYLYPEETGAYTWWSYMFRAREKNAGWRIDYFLVSDRLKERIEDNIIHKDVMGSDHCPVELRLK